MRRWTRFRSAAADESGLTLVELLVSILLLSIILGALAGSISVSLAAVADNQREARAIALQSEVIERFEHLPWEDLTIKCDSSGEHPWDSDPPEGNADDTDSVLGEEIVRCDSSAGSGSFAPEAVETRGEGDHEFVVETHVVFVDRDGSATEKETKRIVTFIRWEDVNGSERETVVSAERAPPPKSVGIVPESEDVDNDNVPNDSDNCPETANSDQADSEGWVDADGDGIDDRGSGHSGSPSDPDGVGDACDFDGDGVKNAGDNCPNAFNPPEDLDDDDTTPIEQADEDGDGFGDACDTGDPDTLPAAAINKVTILWDKDQDGDPEEPTSVLCVDGESATLAGTHEIRVEVAFLAEGAGTVEVTFGKWQGNSNSNTPNTTETRTAIFQNSPDTTSPYDWSVFLEDALGRFHDGKTTTIDVDATRSSDGSTAMRTESVPISAGC